MGAGLTFGGEICGFVGRSLGDLLSASLLSTSGARGLCASLEAVMSYRRFGTGVAAGNGPISSPRSLL